MDQELRILMLEDCTSDAQLETLALRKAGIPYLLERVETKDAFIKALKEFQPEVLLVDYHLPSMTGIEALEIAQKECPDVPFIFVTGAMGEEMAVETLKKGATDYILKSNLTRLGTAVRRALEDVQLRLERRKVREALRQSRDYLDAIINAIHDPVFVKDRQHRFALVNDALCGFMGRRREELIGKSDPEFFPKEQVEVFWVKDDAVFDTGRTDTNEEQFTDAAGQVHTIITVKALYTDPAGEKFIVGTIRDISERKQAEDFRELSREVLQILNARSDDMQDIIRRIAALLQARTGCTAVGIRLQDGDDYPYFAQVGFPAGFLETENTLVGRGADGGLCRDQDGKIILECTCGLVISGKADPANPLFTRGGSFWTNDSFPLLDLPPGEDPRINPRNRCMHQGYASLAMVPIRNKGQAIGLVHFCDRRKGRFSVEMIESLEGIGTSIGATLMRQWAEDALRASEERLRTVIENSRDGINLVDLATGRFILISPAQVAMTGFTAAELQNFTSDEAFERVHPDDRERALNQHKRVAAGEDVTEAVEFRWKCKSGEYRWFGHTRTLVRDAQGRPVAIVGVARDITDRKRAKEEKAKLDEKFHQAQKMEAVGLLAGGIAHDFSNVLTAIVGYNYLVLDGLKADHPVRPFSLEVKRATEVGASLSRQLLAMSRQQVARPRVLDLNSVVIETAKLFRRLVGDNIKTVVESQPSLWPVKVDSGQMEQILLNLVVNARDAMPEGGQLTIKTQNVIVIGEGQAYAKLALPPGHHVCVCKGGQSPANTKDAGVTEAGREARARRALPPGEYVCLEVRDTGTGMDAVVQARIFEPFFTTKEAGRGTGLGLATVQGIVEDCRGRICVESAPGQGTAFRICLPRAEGGVAVLLSEGPAQAAVGGDEAILVVEDNTLLMELLKKTLRLHGYRVFGAASGAQALESCGKPKQRIDIVLMDLVLPDINGGELFAQLKLLRPELKVAYMSGYPGALMDGANLSSDTAFIEKPFSIENLLGVLRRELDAGRAAKERPASS